MSDDFGAAWDADEVKQLIDSFDEADQLAEEQVRQSEQGAQQAAYELQAESANLATATAAVNESAERVARIFDSESDGAASDYRTYQQSLETHANNINQSAGCITQATTADDVNPQVDYLPVEIEQLKTDAEALKAAHDRAPERVKAQSSELPEQVGIVQSLCTSVTTLVGNVSAWYADVAWKREVLTENRARHLAEVQAKGMQELRTGRMPDYGDPENVYEDIQRIRRWSEEDDATIAAARQGREDL